MNKFKKKILCTAIVTSLLSSSISANSGVSIAQLAQSSGSQDCIEWRVQGICYWLFCTMYGCQVRTSTKVRHFLPDVVVSVYDGKGQSPYNEAKSLNTETSSIDGVKNKLETSRLQRFSGKFNTQLKHKNAEAIGHPGGQVFRMLENTGYYCGGQAIPMFPYFTSGLDFISWRMGLIEMLDPRSFTPFMREIRKNADTWGNIFPRTGAVTQVHDYKAAAVIAQRVADIVSRDWQPHIYYPLTEKQNQANGRWPPKEVIELQKNTHKWQALYPKMEQKCHIFPDGHENDSLKKDQRYAWALWRPYSCCKRKGQTFLYSVDFYGENE